MTRKDNLGTALAPRREGGVSSWSSPWSAMDQMRREMDDLFARSFGFTPLARLVDSSQAAFDPVVDMYETNDEVVLFASLPGYAPEEINVEATADTVTIQGERKPIFTDEKATVHRQGWVATSGNVSVSYTLPVEIDSGRITATFKNGILELRLPKAEHVKPKAVKVDVSHA